MIFLTHYVEEKQKFIENKPLGFRNPVEIKIYEITFNKHQEYYDFYNSEKLIEDFLFFTF